jgi:hypothetical protein
LCVLDWRISNYQFTTEASKFNQSLLNAKSRGVIIKCLLNDNNLVKLLNEHWYLMLKVLEVKNLLMLNVF